MTQQRLNDLVFVWYNLRLRTRKVEGVSHESIDLDDIDPYGEWTIDEQNDEADVFLTDEDLAELERAAAEEEAARLDAMEDDEDTFEYHVSPVRSPSPRLDTIARAPSSSRPPKLSTIGRGKRKM